MKKRQTRLMFLGVVFGVGLLFATACGAETVCTKNLISPVYPMLARQARITGTVIVSLEVNPDGSVHSAVVSGAHKLLNRATEDSVKKWTFCSVAESFKLKLTFVYRLEGKPEYPMTTPPKVRFHLPRVDIVARPPDAQV